MGWRAIDESGQAYPREPDCVRCRPARRPGRATTPAAGWRATEQDRDILLPVRGVHRRFRRRSGRGRRTRIDDRGSIGSQQLPVLHLELAGVEAELQIASIEHFAVRALQNGQQHADSSVPA